MEKGEKKRYSSIVDLQRTATKRTSRVKQPLVILFCGQAGMGASTLVDMLLLEVPTKDERYFGVAMNGEEKELSGPNDPLLKESTLSYREVTAEMLSGQKLIFLDFQGMDDPNTRTIAPLVEMVKRRFASFLESNDIEFMVRAGASKEKGEKPERKKVDNRVHGCIYLLNPGAITKSDAKCMKVLADVVNLIPVFGRADSFTGSELVEYKKKLADELDSGEILCYGNVVPPPPSTPDPELTKMIEVFSQLALKMPFAVIASTTKVTINGMLTLGREYPWGVVNATKESQSDLYALQTLFENNSDDLKTRTNDVVYEEYRKARLAALKVVPVSTA
jgi:septin family protein